MPCALLSVFVVTTLALAACDSDPSGGESSCTDGIDNDDNGLTDCDDLACIGDVACMGTDGGMPDASMGCGPATCTGCCNLGRCLGGESLAACGQGGGECVACVLGATCEAAGCVGGPVACGPDNCAGCCMGDICVDGDRPALCGSGGGACDTCDTWEICATGACGVDPTSEWQISILDAVIPPTNFDGGGWDGPGAGECDPYVQLRVGSAGATPLTLPGIDGTVMPDWTEGGTTTVLSPRVTAAEILAFLRFDMFDEDLAFDDTIGSCRYAEGETPFNGEIVTLVCDPDATLEYAGFTLRWQLVPG